MIMCMPSTPSPPKIVMPPPPPPPAMRDEPELAQAELEMSADDTQKGSKRKYRKVVKDKGKSIASSKYKGGGLNVV